MDDNNLQGMDPTATPQDIPDLIEDCDILTTAYKQKHQPFSPGGLVLYGLAAAALIVFAWWLTVEIRKWTAPQNAQASPTNTANRKINTDIPASRKKVQVKWTARMVDKSSTTAGRTRQPWQPQAAQAEEEPSGLLGLASLFAPRRRALVSSEMTDAQYKQFQSELDKTSYSEQPWLDRTAALLPPKPQATAKSPYAQPEPAVQAPPAIDPRYGPYVPSSSYATRTGPGGKPLPAAKGAKGPASPEDRFKLSVILVRNGEPVAIINDKNVRVGDTIEGGKVVAISKYSVDIEVDGQVLTIRL